MPIMLYQMRPRLFFNPVKLTNLLLQSQWAAFVWFKKEKVINCLWTILSKAIFENIFQNDLRKVAHLSSKAILKRQQAEPSWVIKVSIVHHNNPCPKGNWCQSIPASLKTGLLSIHLLLVFDEQNVPDLGPQQREASASFLDLEHLAS